MRSPDLLLRAVAQLAPGKRLTVLAAGKAYELPIEPERPPVALPDPLEVLAQQLLERDAESRTQQAADTARAAAQASSVEGLLKATIDGQRRIVETLFLPVVPTKYDKEGRIIEARRKGESE